MERFNPYHRSRQALTQMSVLAAATNYSKPQEVEKIYRLGVDVFSRLTMGAERALRPTGFAIGTPAVAQRENEYVHDAQDKLEELLAFMYFKSKSGQDLVGDAAEFYFALTKFHALYVCQGTWVEQ